MANRTSNYSYTPSYTGNGRGSAKGNPPPRQQQRPAQRQPQPQNTAYRQPTGPRPAQVRYVQAPRQNTRPMKDLLMLALVLFITPLVGIIGIFYTPFLWAFVVLAAVCLMAMWMGRCFAQGTRVLVTGVLLVAAVLSLIGVMKLSSEPETYPVVNGANILQQQYADSQYTQGDGANLAASQQSDPLSANTQQQAPAVTAPINMGFSVAAPTEPPVAEVASANTGEQTYVAYDSQSQTNTQLNVGVPGSEDASPPVNAVLNSAQQALVSYLNEWANQDYVAMVQYALPSWRSVQAEPHRTLYWYHYWWVLNRWTISSEATSPSADSATFVVTADLTKNDSNKTPVQMSYTATVFESGGTWYVDPDSMRNGLPVTQTPPPQEGQAVVDAGVPVEPTVDPAMRLWYNSEGGSFYHAVEKCSEINEKYYKSMKEFTYSLLNESPYNKLKPCSACSAPKKAN